MKRHFNCGKIVILYYSTAGKAVDRANFEPDKRTNHLFHCFKNKVGITDVFTLIKYKNRKPKNCIDSVSLL